MLIVPLGFIAGIGCFDYWAQYIVGAKLPEGHADHGAYSWRDYFKVNTDHKVIGIQYLVTTFVFFLIGGMLAEAFRAQLASPDNQYFTQDTYNGLISTHASIMIFLFIIPAFAGIANYVVPLMLGAEDMAFPRLNALSFWMLPTAGVIMVLSLLWGGFNTGWTGYATLSTADPTDQGTFFNMGVQFAGTSSILTAVNFIVTILTMRAPGMTLSRMPLLVWANLTTSALVVLGTPFIAASQFMVMFDRVMHTKFFDVAAGGSTIMYQHIFWFYSHPAVYIMMLPGFGIISEVISVMARKPIFGYRALAFSTVSIGVLGFSVWAHHMFVAGIQPWLRVPIMITTMLIAVPTGIKVFSWVATLYGGVINLATPMLWSLGLPVHVRDRRPLGHLAGRAPDRHPGLRHVLRRRAHPLRAVRRVSLHDLRGPLLLVPEDHGPDVQREARQMALLADVHLVQLHVLPAALPRHARHAAAGLDV